jgi:hypothetical protein
MIARARTLITSGIRAAVTSAQLKTFVAFGKHESFLNRLHMPCYAPKRLQR